MISKLKTLSSVLCLSTLSPILFAQGAAQTGSKSAGENRTPSVKTVNEQQAVRDAGDTSTYATGKPLEGQSREGFWGKVNPFARKKWVKRQFDPIRDRTNELDQLESKNANDIKDVDSRSQAGIERATTSASLADRHAADARNGAEAAQNVAADALSRTNSLSGTVSNLDQYQTVLSTPVAFPAGHVLLGPKGKGELDAVAARLAGEKGYIIEVEGYSRSGVQSSQAMADSVARYLVTQHGVPIYRIYRTGLGKASDGTGKRITNGVMVSLMQNSLANANANAKSTSPVASRSQANTGVSTPEID